MSLDVRPNIAGTANYPGTSYSGSAIFGRNDGYYAREVAVGIRRETWTRFGCGPRLGRDDGAYGLEENLIVEKLMYLGLTCPDLVARRRGLYRVSWQHIEYVD